MTRSKGCMYRAGRLELHVNTFFGNRKLSAVGDLDSLDRFVAGALVDALDLLDDVVTLENLAEDDVATIQPTAEITIVSLFFS